MTGILRFTGGSFRYLWSRDIWLNFPARIRLAATGQIPSLIASYTVKNQLRRFHLYIL